MFITFAFFVIVLMLNLLITIMVDAYSKVKESELSRVCVNAPSSSLSTSCSYRGGRPTAATCTSQRPWRTARLAKRNKRGKDLVGVSRSCGRR
jgi:hypothetical protein